ncbi:MAG: carbonic anhydrase [Reyranellaceae bacterium]
MTTHIHHAACGCMPALSRRSALGLGFGAAVMAAFPALAQSKSFEAMLVNCIDPRVTTTSLGYMVSRGFMNQYSQFVFAGGPIGAVAPAFEHWHKTFWENLAISIQLHNIKRVVGFTHRDCGAAFVAYGDALKTDKALETAKQSEALKQFRAEVIKRHPNLSVDTGIMAIDGLVEVVS